MTEILLGIALFTAIVLALVLGVLAARAVLLPHGTVALTVNGAAPRQVPAGERLHAVLGQAGIHLPSACGGVGTCGLCRVRVVAGGGTILPVERTCIIGRDAARGDRLACQVPVVRDLVVEVPDAVFGVGRWTCRLRSTRFVTPLMKELVLDLPAGESLAFHAGAFVQVTSPPHALRLAELELPDPVREAWGGMGLLALTSASTAPVSRAYSLANHPGEGACVMLIVRIAIPPPGSSPGVPPGVVSSWLFSLRAGDEVEIAGPHGHFFVEEDACELVFIGGGAGMAPMRSHILTQLEHRKTQRAISFWYGARSARDVFYTETFDRLEREHANFRWTVALSEPRPQDQWTGATGFIHQVAHDQYLAEHPAPESCAYYLCGPPVMVRAVVAMLDGLGVDADRIRYDDFGG